MSPMRNTRNLGRPLPGTGTRSSRRYGVTHTLSWYCHRLVVWCFGLVAGCLVWGVVFRRPVGRLFVGFGGVRFDVGRLGLALSPVGLVVVVVVVDGNGGDGGDGDVFELFVESVGVALSRVAFFVFLAATKSGSNTRRMVGFSWNWVSFQAALALVNPSANCRSLLTQRISRSSARIRSLHARTSIEVRFSERFSPVERDRSTASYKDLQSVTSGDSQTVRMASSAPCLRSIPCGERISAKNSLQNSSASRASAYAWTSAESDDRATRRRRNERQSIRLISLSLPSSSPRSAPAIT